MLRAPIAALFSCMAATCCFAAEIPAATTEPARTTQSGPSFNIDEFAFTGNSVFDDEILAAVLLHYLQRPLQLDDLYQAADELTRFYREKGFGLASAAIPPQDVTIGAVRLEIVEGRIGAISVSGNENYATGMILDHMPAAFPNKLLNTKNLQQQLLLLNDLPGLDVRATITPGDDYGYSNIELHAEEDASQFDVMLDDYGRDALGRNRGSLNLLVNNPLGIGDSLAATLLAAEEGLLRYVNLEYNLPLGRNGSRLGFAVNRADYEAGEEFAVLGVVGENNFIRTSFSTPLLRNHEWRVGLTAGASRFDTRSEITALPVPASESTLNIAEFGITAEFETRGTLLAAAMSLSGNGRHNESTLFQRDTDAQRAKLALDFKGSRTLAGNWWLKGAFSAAYSRDILPDSQQFSIGGPFSVRGYEPAAIRGDAGYATSLELHRYLEWFGLPGSVSVQADAGRGFRHLLPGEPDFDWRGVRLASAGLGLKLGRSEGFRLDLSVHRPLGHAPDVLNLDESTKFWAGIGYRF